MARNKLKNSINKSKESTPKKSKKTTSLKLPKFNFDKLKELKSKWDTFIENRKNRQFIGITILFSSACTLLAFTSYYVNWIGDTKAWQIDQSEIFSAKNGLNYVLNSDFQGNNWLGRYGGFVAHYFLYARFGLASVLLIVWFTFLGLRLGFDWNKVSLKKSFKWTLLFTIWGSTLFAFLTNTETYSGDLGGGFGYKINVYLESVLGGVGTLFLLIVSLLAILIFNFNLNLKRIGQFIFSDKEESPEFDAEEKVNITVNKPDYIPEEPSDKEASYSPDEEPVQEDNEGSASTFTFEGDNLNESNESDTSIDSNEEQVEEKEEEEEKAPQIDLSADIEKKTEPAKESTDQLSFTVEEKIEEELVSDKEVNEKVKDFGEYDPKLDLSNYQLPNIDLLEDHGDGIVDVSKEELEANKDKIVETLQNYKIEISEIKATVGPTITLYEIVPAPGVRLSKIKNLEDDIALSLAALGIRIIAPIPGRGTVGIEVPNSNPAIVSMRSVIASPKFNNSKMDLPIALGKTIQNETFVTDLAKMPHLLMAGATGQGKSVGLNCILTSLLYKKHPSQLKFVLVDPKKVELTLFNKIERHYLAKLPDTEEAIITDTSKVVQTVNSLCVEMDERYDLLKKALCRNIKEYNNKFIKRKLNPEKGHRYLPYIVLVIDEFADLIMTAGKEIETPIARLAQLARAIGIHLIVATQRPSVNIITGTIKANFPARIAFRVTAKIDSRTILDAGGADQLIGRGDMLLSTGADLLRIQCAFVDTPEVEEICDFIGSQRAYPTAFMLPEVDDPEAESGPGDIDKEDRDELFVDAARLVVSTQQGSTSMLQRKLKLGYNRAGRIVDQLEAAGILGPFEGSKARKVLIPDEYSLEQFLNNEDENGNL